MEKDTSWPWLLGPTPFLCVFRPQTSTAIDSTRKDTGPTSPVISRRGKLMSRVRGSRIREPQTAASIPYSSVSGGSVAAELGRPSQLSEAPLPQGTEYVTLYSTQNWIAGRVELTPEQAEDLDFAVRSAEPVGLSLRQPWVGVVVRTSKGRYVVRRGLVWVGDDSPRDARSVLPVLRRVIPIALHAEVGRHLYAPLVGDSFEPLKYYW